MFLFGDGVRLSLQDNPDVITHKDNAKYLRATVNTINKTLGSNKWTMNLEQTNIEEAAIEATSPGKKGDAKQKALDMSVHHLGVLHKMIRESQRCQYDVSRAACLEELQDYVKLNGDEMLSGRMHTTNGKLPQKEKDAMNETSLKLHFYEMEKKRRRV